MAEVARRANVGDKMLFKALSAEGDQANLSKAERNDLADLVKLLVQSWKRKPT